MPETAPSTLPPDDAFRVAVIKAATGVGVLGGGPLSAPRVMADLCNPALTLAELTQVLNQEPGLVARVLRVANSAYYGVARHVATLDRALVILGLDAVRSIAAAACLDQGLMQATLRSGIDRIALVRHGLAVAVGAEQLALKRHRGVASEAFIAGLLHNLGIPLQGLLHPEAPQRLTLALQEQPESGIRDLEAQAGVPRHEDCGAVVLAAWNLPQTLVEAVRHHHDPMAAREPHRKLATLVHLGLELAAGTGHGFSLEPQPGAARSTALMRLGLTPEELDEVAQDLPRRVMSFRRALQGE